MSVCPSSIFLLSLFLFFIFTREVPSSTPRHRKSIFGDFPVFWEFCARGVASTLAPLVEVRSRHTAHFMNYLSVCPSHKLKQKTVFFSNLPSFEVEVWYRDTADFITIRTASLATMNTKCCSIVYRACQCRTKLASISFSVSYITKLQLWAISSWFTTSHGSNVRIYVILNNESCCALLIIRSCLQ